MRRGTTPTLEITPTVLVDGEEQVLDLSGYDTVVLTFKCACHELDIGKERLAFNEGVIAVTLTQEETLSFEGKAEMQVRAVKDGVAIASSIVTVDFSRILMEGVLE